MGTVLYGASSGAPAITPTIVQAGWSFTSSAIQRKAAAVISDPSSAATWGPDTARSGGPQGSCLGQWIYGPIAAQAFTGTCALSMFGVDTTFVSYYCAAMGLWIAKPDGTLRANVLAMTPDPNQNTWTTSMQQYTISPQTLSGNSALSGDYLILECGDYAISNFVNAEAGSAGVGNSRVVFTFSNSIQTQNAVANTTTVWLGKPQPRR